MHDEGELRDLRELPAILTAVEAARVMRVSRGVLYEAARAGTIPSVRLGRSLRIPRDGLLRFLEQEPRDEESVAIPDGTEGWQ